MTTIFRLLAPVCVGLLVAAPAPAADFDPEAWRTRQSRLLQREAAVAAGGADVRMQIWVEPERQAWARALATDLHALVPVFVQRFGPLPFEGPLMIIEEPALPGPGWSGGAAGVRLRFGSDVVDLARQLAHLWVRPQTVADSWLQEGVAGWEALRALRLAGYGEAAEQHFLQIVRETQSVWTDRDFPLAGVDLRREPEVRARFGRQKATLVAALIEAALGERGWSGIVTGLPQASGYGLDALVAAIEAGGRTAGPMLAGWVTPGAYTVWKWSDLADRDGDGLPDALEALTGSRLDNPDTDGDNLGDGWEYWRGFSPTSRDSLGDGKGDAARAGIAVDGLGGDWDARGLQPIVIDFPAGDGVPYDLTQVWMTTDSERLYVRIDTAEPLPAGGRWWLTVLFDVDGDRQPDLVVALDDQDRAWYSRFRRGAPLPEAGERDARMVARRGRVVEMALPRDLLERTAVRFTVRLDTPRGEAPIDHLGGWWQPADLAAMQLR